MFKRSTVMILGAGASIPYGFPSGAALRKQVIEAGGNRAIDQHTGSERPEIEKFCAELQKSQQRSVDAFLEHRPEFLSVGKKMIAWCLIQCEKESALLRPERDEWYTDLYAWMNAPFDSFANNQLAFVTFNYDRSLEHFLFTALQSTYGLSREDTAQLLSNIPILHPHGKLGRLPWQEGDAGMRTYEPRCTVETVQIAASGIRVVSDAVDEDPEFARATELITDADQVLFLGFGYLEQNVRRLKVPFSGDEHFRSNRLIWGTCKGFSPSEASVLKSKYQGLNLAHPSHLIVEALKSNEQFLHSCL